MPTNPQTINDGPNLLVNTVQVLLIVVPAWLIIYGFRRWKKGKHSDQQKPGA